MVVCRAGLSLLYYNTYIHTYEKVTFLISPLSFPGKFHPSAFPFGIVQQYQGERERKETTDWLRCSRQTRKMGLKTMGRSERERGNKRSLTLSHCQRKPPDGKQEEEIDM